MHGVRGLVTVELVCRFVWNGSGWGRWLVVVVAVVVAVVVGWAVWVAGWWGGRAVWLGCKGRSRSSCGRWLVVVVVVEGLGWARLVRGSLGVVWLVVLLVCRGVGLGWV